MTTASDKLSRVLLAIANIRANGRGVKPLPTTTTPATAIPARPGSQSIGTRIAPLPPSRPSE